MMLGNSVLKTLESLKDFFAGKNVLIVGNSVEIMNHDNGNLIDSYDIVVRLGKGVLYPNKDEVALGKKLDVWITGFLRAPLVDNTRVAPKLKDKLILFNSSRADIHSAIPVIKYEYPILFSDHEIISYYKKYNIDLTKEFYRFSAGLWAILYFLEKIKTQKSLTIIGFDFFKASVNLKCEDGIHYYHPHSWHMPKYKKEHADKKIHNGSLEEQIVGGYVEENKLTWIKLYENNVPRIYKKLKYGAVSKDLFLYNLEKYFHNQYKAMHESTGKYFPGNSLLDSYIPIIKDLVESTQSENILDFGCGRALKYKKYKINKQFNIEDENVYLYDPGILEYSTLPDGQYDGLICTDVLEHIPEPLIDNTIKMICSKANKFIFVSIHCGLAVKTLPDGRNAHVTIKPPGWWRDKFKKFCPETVKVEARFSIPLDPKLNILNL